ncbi:MAG: AsmA family protein, partial [Silvanigrellales bacterium]|nr:AsmA family protein [Silvanigrellales bacterium]
MKRTLKIILGSLGALVVLVLALVALPFLIDFNRFKPQIQALVAEQVNAKIDFESARLTILTGLGVKLTKVTIENTDPKFSGTRLFAVDELVFRTALAPLFERKFVGTVKIDRPEIVVVRAGLASNLTSLAKEKKPAAESGSPEVSPTPLPGEPPLTPGETQARGAEIEELKKNIVVESLSINDASLTLREVGVEGTKDSVRIRELDLDVTNIGADRDIRVLLSTRANVNQPGVRVNGPFELSLTTRVLT